MNKKDDALDLESRRKIFDLISEKPGTYMREIQKILDMPTGQLDYHLNYLKEHELIGWESISNKKRYFVNDEVSYPDRKMLSILRQDIPRKILLILLEEGKKTFGDLHDHFDVSKSTLSFHLKKLVKLNIIKGEREGRKKIFSCIETKKIAQVLITYQESFVDKAVDNFVDVWMEMKR